MQPLCETVVRSSLDSMIHRGPDDSGILQDQNISLAMRRLIVIDPETGRQPVSNEDQTVSVVLNGEIYNYMELRDKLVSRGHIFQTQSDTEVLVHLYEEYGTDMCQHLRGMFAFAIWDRSRRRLLMARDRFGKKPCYYSQPPQGGIVFASEIKALRPLLDAVGVDCTLNWQGVYDFLSLGVVPQPSTIYRQIQTLPPASWLLYDGESVTVQRYWSLDWTPSALTPAMDVCELTRNHISEAVRIRLRSDVPLGIFLSGGLDSSIVALEASRQISGNLDCFTIATDDARYDESHIARRTAGLLGIRHRVLPLRIDPLEELTQLVKQYDQPYADYSALPTMAISRLAKQHVTVVLNGDGGDEVFGGYRRYRATQWASRLQILPRPVSKATSKLLLKVARQQRRSGAGFASRFLRGLGQSDSQRYLSWTTDLLQEADKELCWDGPPQRPTESWLGEILHGNLRGVNRQQQADIDIQLLSDLLVKMDVATMAHSLEARSPLLDHKLAEFVAGLPVSVRLRGGKLKGLLRDAYRDHLPAEVIEGRKRGFEFPLRSWLENELREILMDTVGSPSARIREFINGQFLDDLLTQRILGERNWACLVYSLLVLELWLQSAAGRQLDHSCPGTSRTLCAA
ncbi:MAG: asparagine synthase (glutamine-hydrolyzing) [Planctomycetaceae bacterium]|nr:asparagine synthase (glutamine-hydrolyzing) [Planctomycetaceae bacterium]